jgi:Protein of unknown function (DUF2735)
MNVNSPPNTAKIYQFPVKGAAGLRGPARDLGPAGDYRLQAAPTVDFGSGWYHEAAIQADRLRKS